MKKFREKMSERAGFTLVELIVVIAILGILAGAAVAGYSGYITKAKAAADTQIMSVVKTAADGALATKGAVDKITITPVESGDAQIVAEIGSVNYLLQGTGNKDALYYSESDNDDIREDFKLFLSGNAVTFTQTEGPEKVTKAEWTPADGWKVTLG